MNKHKQHHYGPEQAKSEDAKSQVPGEETQPQDAASISPEQADWKTISDKAAEVQKTLIFRELAAAKDREMRAHAEMDNVRKRAARELEEHRRYANLSLLRDLLPVLDNVDRAIEAADKNADPAALLEGFKMVSQQLGEVLKRHHCTRIEALHAPFDPNVHHAVMQQPSDEYPANTVLMVTQNGYQLHDRVVRPSQVIVSTPK